MMPVIDRTPINTNNDDDHYERSLERQEKADQKYDTLRNYNSIAIGSTVVAQQEYGGLWIHGTTRDKGAHIHNDCSNSVHVTKTEWLRTWKS